MIEPTGNYRMLDTFTLPLDAPEGSLLVVGDEPTVKAMAAKVQLGHAEQERRRARRRQQRLSRRRNR